MWYPKLPEWLERDELVDLARMWPTLILAAATFALVWWIAPQQIGILVYTMAKLSLALYLGYWGDRWLYPVDRPGELMSPADNVADVVRSGIAQLRRALIVGCCLLAAGLMS